MTITEIFLNPTVKKVIFQIRFPNLFFIESKIGEYQLKIMEQFPESSLLLRRQILFADVGQEVDLRQEFADKEDAAAKKIWQFRSTKEVKLNVLSNSLDILSEYHKRVHCKKVSSRFSSYKSGTKPLKMTLNRIHYPWKRRKSPSKWEKFLSDPAEPSICSGVSICIPRNCSA